MRTNSHMRRVYYEVEPMAVYHLKGGKKIELLDIVKDEHGVEWGIMRILGEICARKVKYGKRNVYFRIFDKHFVLKDFEKLVGRNEN